MPFELMAKPCNQCLLTTNKIVSNARRRDILKTTIRRDCSFQCHKTPPGRDIACRGHFNVTGGGQLARIAGRLNMIVEIDPDALQENVL